MIVGGGFGGIAAARKLHKADAEVDLVDGTSYHTFQPMLYQVATALIDTSEVAHPLRDLFHDQPNAAVHWRPLRRSTSNAGGSSSTRWPRSTTTTSSSGSGPGTTISAPKGRPSTGSRCTRSPTPWCVKAHVLRRWEAADRDPSLVDDGALTRRRRRRRADRGGERWRPRRALPQRLRQGLPQPADGEGAPDPGRGWAEPFAMFEPRSSQERPLRDSRGLGASRSCAPSDRYRRLRRRA